MVSQAVLVATVVTAVLLVSAAVSGDTAEMLATPRFAERGARHRMELAQAGLATQLLLLLVIRYIFIIDSPIGNHVPCIWNAHM